jgi:tight adherence protein C
MIVVLLIGLFFIGLAAALFARALLVSRRYATETVSQIGAYGFESEQPAGARGRWGGGASTRFSPRSSLDSVATALGGSISSRVRSVSEEGLRKRLLAAGFYTMPPRRFVGYQALSAVGAAVITTWWALAAGVHPLLGLCVLVIALLGGWTLPLVYVKRRGRLRGERIDYEMPELIDTLVTTVEAGLSFSASLQIASRRFRGPLGDEVRLTLQEQSMGLAVNDALNNMLMRCDTPAVRSFVRSILQGEQLGVSIGQTLRNLAQEMRARRRHMAEERAQKAPVKILFPLILLIFPALMVVMLGPAAIRIYGIFD